MVDRKIAAITLSRLSNLSDQTIGSASKWTFCGMAHTANSASADLLNYHSSPDDVYSDTERIALAAV